MEEVPSVGEVKKYFTEFFGKYVSVRGETKRRQVGPDTPIKDFFHADMDGISLEFGKPIEEKFGLEPLRFMWGLPSHSYRIGRSEEEFYAKYSKDAFKELTVEQFAEMVYDLIMIKNGLKIT